MLLGSVTGSKCCSNQVKYLDKTKNDTLDLVPVAAFSNNGAEEQQCNSFLMAALTENKLIPLCKLGIGFSREEVKEINAKMKVIGNISPKVTDLPKGAKPKYFLKPDQVWEVGFDSFSESSIYKCGDSSLARGLSLRFPRFIRFRPDKSVLDASSETQVRC